MITYLGMVAAGTTLYVPFPTFNSSGASVTITGLAVTDIEIYKNGSTTQRSSDNGYTLLDTDGIDFDGITGIHGFSIDLSDNSDAGFYSAGGQYWIVVSSITIDGQTVNFIAGIFSIEPAVGINVNVVANAGTAITSASGIQEVKVASIAANAITATAIAADAITAAKVADGTIDAATFAAGAINAAAIASDAITAAKVADGTIDAATFATGAITAAAIAADAITAAKVADGTIDAATFAAGAINAAAIASDAITDAKVASDVTIASVTGAVGSVTGNVGGNVVGSVASVTGNVGGNVTGSVGSVATGGIVAASFAAGAINAAAIAADAITDAKVASDVTIASVTGAVGSVTGAVGSVTGNVGGNVTGSVGSVVGAVGSVTGNVGGNVTGSVGSVAAGGITASSLAADAITAAKVAADVTTEIQSGLATASALTTVDTVVDAILAMLDDARGEPGQGAPPVNPDLATKVDWLYKLMRNKITQNATTLSVYADDATTVDHKAPVSDDGTTYTRGELIAGP